MKETFFLLITEEGTPNSPEAFDKYIEGLVAYANENEIC